MKIAILDLGTNTFHLLIADVVTNNQIKILYRTRAIVKLGKGGIGENRIAELPFEKGIQTIRNFNTTIKKFKVKSIFAFATSAIRSSVNGSEFVHRAKKETGLRIRVISGKEEAELIYFGVRQCVPLSEKPVLIMDIGGGSTEFINGNQKKIFWKQSFNIGAARLLEKFQPSNPIRKSEIRKMENFLDEALKPLHWAMKKYPVTTLIGSSGSFDTLAEMLSYRLYKKNILRSKKFYHFNLQEYFLLHQWLIQSTTSQRMKTKGLVKMRVDMIVTSSICTKYILKKFKLKEMIQSKYALKEGALWKVIHRQKMN